MSCLSPDLGGPTSAMKALVPCNSLAEQALGLSPLLLSAVNTPVSPVSDFLLARFKVGTLTPTILASSE